MRYGTSFGHGRAFVAATIFGFYSRYIHMTDDIAKHGHILSDKQTINLFVRLIGIQKEEENKIIRNERRAWVISMHIRAHRTRSRLETISRFA